MLKRAKKEIEFLVERSEKLTSNNSDYEKCKDLLRRAWMELEHRSLELELTDEIEQHFGIYDTRN